MNDKIAIKGYAKINLGLDVVGKLDNGYHLLRSVMQQIDIYDTLELEILSDKNGENISDKNMNNSSAEQIILTSNSDKVPLDHRNLAFKAAKLLIEKNSIKESVHIHIEKRIPVAAGLAGGSTDAAAVLIGMNELFCLGYGKEELQELGTGLGADVPFCIMGGTALAEGIGEKLTRIDTMPEMYLVIAKPDIDVSTKYVYEHLALDRLDHPDTDGIMKAMRGKDLAAMTELLKNVLESVTVQEYPVIQILKAAMYKEGAVGSLMSGSGPTVFGIFDTMEKAAGAEASLRKIYPAVYVQAVGIIASASMDII